ncbi:FixH family protein [Lentzea sp. BCCO 10_0856]|uniref:FixH family protein n=1 Tax=Lentzea miocenica TaxID=3095431 RepID=A0ABU4T5C5_9PSEU|nr:FixH family protein [Lentzea sp. BCCO 10_0856]MDX8033328.1 FixH family protein [Lentzea sp. BCCO 10_0856]
MKRYVLGGLAAVIAMVGALVVLWPRSVEAQPHLAETAQLRFVLTPASTKSGDNSFDLRVTDRSGNPAAGEVTVEPAMPQMGHAIAPITAGPREPGHYEIGVGLPMAGQWEITVSLSAERVVIPLLLT